MAADCGFCAVFKDRGEAYNAGRGRVCWSRHMRRIHAIPADAGLSKLNSMLGSFAAGALELPK
jgi:hypothetical protein